MIGQKKVTSRVKKTPPGGHETNVQNFFHYIHIEKTATPPPPGGYVFPPIMPIFELVRDIYKIDAKNVYSRVKMTPPPHGGHVFLPIRTIFELNRHWNKNVISRVVNCPAPWRPYINETNVSTKFHDDWAKF
ncbi:hypothetical protein DPMN_070614 [Dreissena polymorpha]|uniref:Uncharacterized protein n=1 Tax=Dreissena polymorpha TaxID=45954 RepID=A0A9D3Z3F8_DREPO|nr:hypothetical protein DPMN_070614 [Dreissena polymorpha]